MTAFIAAAQSLISELGPDPRTNIQLIVARAAGILECDCAAYAAIEAASGSLRFRAAHNLPARPAAARKSARRICSAVISARAAAGESGAAAFGTAAAPRLAAEGFKAFLGHPVAVNGRNAGALVALHGRRRRFGPGERRLLAFLTGLVGIEEGRRELEQALGRRIALVKMLNDLSTLAISSADIPAFTAQCLRMVGSRMGVEASFFWRFSPRRKALNETGAWTVAGRPVRRHGLQDLPADSLAWAAGRLMQGEIIRIGDSRSQPGGPAAEFTEGIGARAALIIPLFSRDAFYGCMGLECRARPNAWAAEDVLILQTAAEIVMRCIENKRLAQELVAGQKQLGRAVAAKTLALRKTNARLSAEVAAHKRSIAALKQRETELADKNRTFIELSNTLAALLNRPGHGPGEPVECLILKLGRMIDAPAAGLAADGPGESQKKYIERLRDGLAQVSALLKTKSAFVFECLSPIEIQVANLIRQDKPTKAIADLLNLSARTVESHRYHIRRKLQLDKRRINLKIYLRSLE